MPQWMQYQAPMWCPQCDSEYRPGFTRCSDCDVDLVDERVPPPPPDDPVVVDHDMVDHDMVEYDLIELADEQADLLVLLLSGAEIPFTWAPTRRLVVAHAVADHVDEILDFVDASAGAAPPAGDELAPSAPTAGPWRRLGGAVIDALVLSLPVWAIRSTFGRGVASWVLLSAVHLAYAIVPIGLWGRTLGKVAVRTRVAMIDGRSPPPLRAAVVRGVVPLVPSLVPGVVFFSITPLALVFALLGTAWTIAVYVPVLFPGHRGRHDIAAGTVVLLDNS
jgi:uncharacterized RDD family membrane protein YckC